MVAGQNVCIVKNKGVIMKTRIGSWCLALAAGTLVCSLGVGRSLAGEEKDLPLEKVPPAVLDAVKAKFPELKLTKASTESEDGKEIVEVAFTVKDDKYEVECTKDGKLLAIDRVIQPKDLPEKVAKAIEDKYPGAKYSMIEEVTKDDKVAYHEVDLKTKDGQSVELQVDPSGKIINEEKKGEEKDGKENKEKKEKD
jgi:uncharacterized membrane protein YkoI